MNKKSAKQVWDSLNERQKTYLSLIYKCDQEKEQEQKSRWHLGWKQEPASKWRWILYGSDLIETRLRILIFHEGYTDKGTGSTFSALARKELIEHALVYVKTPFGHARLPQVKLTTWGRKVARTGLGEQPTKQLPKGTLREWHWEALAMAWAAGADGVDKEETGFYGHKSWKTWLRLRDYDPPLVEEKLHPDLESIWTISRRGQYRIHITKVGEQFYRDNWNKYSTLYPNVDAPKP